MKAIIIYDNFCDAAKARMVLQQCAHNAGLVAPLDIRPWRIDMLKFPPTAAEVLTEAINAHLIVFAGWTAQLSTFRLQMWLEHWAKCRRIEEAAVAVMGSACANLDLSSAGANLAGFAKRHNLDLIIDDAAESKETPRFAACVSGPAVFFNGSRNWPSISVSGQQRPRVADATAGSDDNLSVNRVSSAANWRQAW
jgi:hypothetical protein